MSINKTDISCFLQNNFGVYNKCEIIEIFGKCSNEIFNIYTLVIFEFTQKMQDKITFLTPSPQTFKTYKNCAWGIKRHIVDVSTIEHFFKNLLQGKFMLDKDKESKIGSMRYLPNQYIRANCDGSGGIVQMNYGLKNNFHNGSYIFEFFDESKDQCYFLLKNPKMLLDFSEKISKIIPISLASISDRLGNVIFQFPINNIRVSIESIVKQQQFKGFQISIYTQNSQFDIKNLIIKICKDEDNVIWQKMICVESEKTNIDLDNGYGGFIVEIYDKRSGLIVYKKTIYIMMQMTINTELQELQKRIFITDDGTCSVDISTQAGKSVLGKPKNKLYNQWIRERKYENELRKLEKDKSFVQYIRDNQPKALDDIHSLINKYGKNGVYLWDPYLSADDIKHTLYHCKYAYVKMKVITGLKQSQNKTNEKQKMFELFEKDDKKLLFLDLEVRAKFGNRAYDFHDRFIIFPLTKPMVWSLGISVNQLGKSHHILQEVKHAQHILNAFNELWDLLDNEECLVWKNS